MAIHRRARRSAPSTYGAKQPPTHCLNIGASGIKRTASSAVESMFTTGNAWTISSARTQPILKASDDLVGLGAMLLGRAAAAGLASPWLTASLGCEIPRRAWPMPGGQGKELRECDIRDSHRPAVGVAGGLCAEIPRGAAL